MPASGSFASYGDNTIVPDVLPAIEILTAQENYLLNILSKDRALNTVVETQEDTLRTPGSEAVTEEGDFTNLARTSPTRRVNLIQHVAIPFTVTGTQERVQHFSGQNELARQTSKALKEWANSAEFDLVRSTMTSGASGTSPKMSGVIEAISHADNTTSHTSGTAWDATILDGLMQNNWDKSNGDLATELLMGSVLRSKTDDFTQKTNTLVMQGEMTKIVRTVSVYQTAHGVVNIRNHRFVQQDGDATARVLAIRPDKLSIAFLARPHIQQLAKSGDYNARVVFGSLSLRVKNQVSNWFTDGFLK